MAFIRRCLASPVFHLAAEFILFLLLSVLAIIGIGFANAPQNDVLANGASALAALVTLLIGWKVIERTTTADMGFISPNPWLRVAYSIALGIVLIGTIVGLMALFGWYRVVVVDFNSTTLSAVGSWLLIFICAAFVEEVLFRLIIFRHLEKVLSSWVAVVISALLFGFAHAVNPNASLISSLNIAIEAGVLIALLYMVTRNLWAITGFHAAWNFFEGPIFDTPVSGIRTPSIFTSSIKGPELWTGGQFGPEASLLTLLVCLLVSALLFYQVMKHRLYFVPLWMRRAFKGKDRAIVAEPPMVMEPPVEKGQ